MGHKPDLGNLTKNYFDLEKYAKDHVFGNLDVSKENQQKITALIDLMKKRKVYYTCWIMWKE